MPTRNLALILLVLLLTILGASACTRERTPWPTENPLESRLGKMTPVPTFTPSGPFLPRFTPHVTSPPPTPSPTPVFTATPIRPTPTRAPTATSTGIIKTYTVQPQDTLLDIATKFNVPLLNLARINNITDPTTITPGQQLLIPGR